jgi:hypothetical protein
MKENSSYSHSSALPTFLFTTLSEFSLEYMLRFARSLGRNLFPEGEGEAEFDTFDFTSEVTHSHNVKINRALILHLDNIKLTDSTSYYEGSLISLSSATTYKFYPFHLSFKTLSHKQHFFHDQGMLEICAMASINEVQASTATTIETSVSTELCRAYNNGGYCARDKRGGCPYGKSTSIILSIYTDVF